MESYATSESECSPAQESAAAPIEILISDDAKSTESPAETKSKSMPTKLYVGNLSAGTNRKDLREMFQIYGQVSDVDVVGSFAFVVMPNEAEAEEAIKALHDKKIGGKILIVEKKKQRAAAPARKADRGRGHRDIQLFAARCKEISEEKLTEVFARFGSVVSVKKPRTKPDIAFVAMEHFFQARKAVEALNRRRNVEGLAQPIFVQLSTNNVGRDGRPLTDLLERGETIKLFVGNLDAETEATELGVLFERYGPVMLLFLMLLSSYTFALREINVLLQIRTGFRRRRYQGQGLRLRPHAVESVGRRRRPRTRPNRLQEEEHLRQLFRQEGNEHRTTGGTGGSHLPGRKSRRQSFRAAGG